MKLRDFVEHLNIYNPDAEVVFSYESERDEENEVIVYDEIFLAAVDGHTEYDGKVYVDISFEKEENKHIYDIMGIKGGSL